MSHEGGAQFWSDLYALEITSNECLSKLRSILGCPTKIAATRRFQGNDAETFVNFLDKVLAHSHLDVEVRRRCLRLLSKICKAQRILPTSYFLRRELIRVGAVQDHGGFSEVSNGEYLECAVAIKVLKTNKRDFNKIFRCFCQEVVSWKHLSHPNILPLLGVYVSTGPHRLHILSEWMPNGNLMRHTKSNPGVNRLRLLRDVASGVTYLHELGIAHGDLKGVNILVDRIGAARIGDFGLMTMGDLGTALFSESLDSLGGTLPWMSPELLESASPDSGIRPTRESDCYALGMVIYEVLTGLQPFYGLSVLQIMVAVVTGRHPGKPRGADFLGFSDELWELVQSCWNKSVSTRPPARELLDHLSHASLTWVPSQLYPLAVESDFCSDVSTFYLTKEM